MTCVDKMLKDCALPSNDEELKVLLNRLLTNQNKFIEDANTTLFEQNKKISELCLSLKNELTNNIIALLDVMKATGELDDIIASSTNELVEKIDRQQLYYSEIETVKKYDSKSETYYYVTKVPCKLKDGTPLKLKMGLANDDTTLTSVESTIEFAARKNATLVINGGPYDDANIDSIGTCIKDYVVLNEEVPNEEKYSFLGIKADGSILFFDKNTSASTMLASGVKDAFLIFGALIKNGISVIQSDKRKEPRQSIGVSADGTIIFITCDGRNHGGLGMTYDDLARLHAENGSHNAYILDGGGSTSTVLRGIKQNENHDDHVKDRKVANFLYIEKENKDDIFNVSNDLGKVKQELLEKIVGSVEVLRGFQLLTSPNSLAQLQYAVNGDTDYRARFALSYDKNNERNTYLFVGLKPGESENTKILRVYPQGTWVQVYNGLTGSRPNGVQGLLYYDTNLNKLIIYNGEEWQNVDGTPL